MTAVLHDLTRDFFDYTSDDGNHYNVGSTKMNGTAQSATGVDDGANQPYPRGWVMREVYGVGPAGQKSKCPIFDPGNTIWTGGAGGSFTKDTIAYKVTGCRGEQRYVKGGPAVAH